MTFRYLYRKVEKIYDKDFKKNNKPKPDTEMKNPKPPQP